MQQEKLWGRLRAIFAIENPVSVYIHRLKARHDHTPFQQSPFWTPGASCCAYLASDVLTDIKFHYRCYYLLCVNMRARGPKAAIDWKDGFLFVGNHLAL